MGNKTGEKRLIEEMKDISTVLWIGMLIILGVFYVNFVTYKGKLEGIQTLYVKMDGKNGAVLKINNKYTGKQITIKNSKNQIFLLKGITGSGKTEIYINLIKEALKQGFGSIFLVPEISLTVQMIQRLEEEFHNEVAILHSKLTDKEKREE